MLVGVGGFRVMWYWGEWVMGERRGLDGLMEGDWERVMEKKEEMEV